MIKSEVKLPTYAILVSCFVISVTTVVGATLGSASYFFVAFAAVACWSILTIMLTVVTSHIAGSVFGCEIGLLKPLVVQVLAATLTPLAAGVVIFILQIGLIKMGVIGVSPATHLLVPGIASLLVVLLLVALPFLFFSESSSPRLLVTVVLVCEFLSMHCTERLFDFFFGGSAPMVWPIIT